jgi:hypothetical protein
VRGGVLLEYEELPAYSTAGIIGQLGKLVIEATGKNVIVHQYNMSNPKLFMQLNIFETLFLSF